MTRLFVAGLTQFLEIDAAPIIAPPFTMSCWFRFDAVANGSMMWIGDKDNGVNYWAINGNLFGAGDPLQFLARNAAGETITETSTGISIGVWYHALAIARASDDRSILLDAGGEGTSAVNRLPLNADRISIGRHGDSSPGRYMSGAVAEPVVWNTVLTRQEGQKLADGYPAVFIRPQSRVAYWPLTSAEDFDWQRRYDLTAFNTPGVAPHPPKVLEFWRRYRMRAVTTQGISRLVSWGVPNEWNVRAMAPSVGITLPIMSSRGIHSVIGGGQIVR